MVLYGPLNADSIQVLILLLNLYGVWVRREILYLYLSTEKD